MDFNVVKGTSSGGGLKNKHSFQYEEMDADNDLKWVYTIYGDKGHGKTTMAMSLTGQKHVICLDNKSARIKSNMYDNDESIHIVDGLKHFSESEDELLASSEKTLDWIIFCLGEIGRNGGTDWVIIDGLERLSYVAEMKMRKEGKITPFGGVSNLNLWKKRRIYLRHIHRMAMAVSRKGMVYTTYPKIRTLMNDDGMEVRDKVPNWIDIVLEETDFVIRAESQKVKGKQVFLAFCESSKNDKMMVTGKTYNVTDGTLDKLEEVEEEGSDST
jgi:hypothetical protein